MEATIEFDGITATLKGWRWTCSDYEWEQALNGLLDPNGPSQSYPQPNIMEARRVAKMLQGKVVNEVEGAPEDPNLVY